MFNFFFLNFDHDNLFGSILQGKDRTGSAIASVAPAAALRSVLLANKKHERLVDYLGERLKFQKDEERSGAQGVNAGLPDSGIVSL